MLTASRYPVNYTLYLCSTENYKNVDNDCENDDFVNLIGTVEMPMSLVVCHQHDTPQSTSILTHLHQKFVNISHCFTQIIVES